MALPELVSPPREYRQHRPEDTLLYRLVADHLETFLRHAREHHDHGLPAYVENELRSYLKCGIHFHVAVPDGVFTLGKDPERADFHPVSEPSRTELDTLAFNVEMRVTAWLRRRGLLADDDGDARGDTGGRSALDACLEGSLGMGELSALPAKRSRAATGDADAPPPVPRSGQHGGHSRGFDVHAGVVVSGSDREGRERLLRYCARPPLSLERLSVLSDGRVAYAIRKPWGKETHRVMEPIQFLARLAALVPPPRRPLLRFHGVLAPHSSWRKKVVPLRVRCDGRRGEQCKGAASPREASVRSPDEEERSRSDLITLVAGTSDCSGSVSMGSAPNCTAVAAPVHCAPFALRAPSARIDWSELLKRIYDVDSLACSCGGRLQFIALILEEAAARAILESLGLPSRAPPVARARSPDWIDPIPDNDE